MDAAYGFDPAKLRAARSAAGASVRRIASAAGVTERAVSLYLAGTRVPRPRILPGLAAAVGVTPAGLCTVDHEQLVHLRVWTGRNRTAMAAVLGMAAETYRLLETTGEPGRLSSSRYDSTHGGWIRWEQWAAPLFQVTPERLLAARRTTHTLYRAELEESTRRWRARHPERAAELDRIARELKGQR